MIPSISWSSVTGVGLHKMCMASTFFGPVRTTLASYTILKKRAFSWRMLHFSLLSKRPFSIATFIWLCKFLSCSRLVCPYTATSSVLLTVPGAPFQALLSRSFKVKCYGAIWLAMYSFLLNLARASHGGISYFHFVCVCVCLCVCVSVDKISQNVFNQSTSFLVGGSLPCDPRKKWLDFEKKNRPGVRVGLWRSKFGLNGKR